MVSRPAKTEQFTNQPLINVSTISTRFKYISGLLSTVRASRSISLAIMTDKLIYSVHIYIYIYRDKTHVIQVGMVHAQQTIQKNTRFQLEGAENYP